MRQSKFTRAMALMLSLVMVTSVFVGNTLSRYVTSVSSTDNARVAVWGINGEEVTMELFNTEYDLGGKLIAKSNVNGEKIIAPGTGGQSAFSIINFESDTIPPEVAYDVKISLDDSQVDPKIINNSSIQWKLDNNSWGTFDQLKTSLLSLVGDPSGLKTYAPGTFADAFKGDVEHKIYWQWVMDGNNELDTQMGNDALISPIGVKISVSITAEQSDGSSVNMLDGANQVINLYSVEPATFRSVAPMEDLLNVTVNDEIVDPSNYDVASGSTIITFHKDYLETLEEGTYTININSKNDITATAKFYVVEKYVPIVHNGIIPEGATYYVKVPAAEEICDDVGGGEVYCYNSSNLYIGSYDGAVEVLTAGDEFPETVNTNDVYVYGDYEYRYNVKYYYNDMGTDIDESLNGWGVGLLNKNKTSYGEILTTINGKNVVNLDTLFAECSNLVKAPFIPNTVTSLYETFYGCSDLIEVPEIPYGVINMDVTFVNCESLKEVPEIPDSVKSMSSTFRGCTSLVNAPVIPNSVTNMGDTFYGCTSLVNAPVIPNGVTYMYNTFYGCTSLVDAPVIPNSVTNMYSTFYGCTNLTGTIEINANPTSYTDVLKGTQITWITGSISDSLKQTIATNSKITLEKPSTIIDGGDSSKTGIYYSDTSSNVPGNYGASYKYINGAMPETVKTGDIYIEGDYQYRYNVEFSGTGLVTNENLNGWSVSVLDNEKEEYGEILNSILGKDIVSLRYAFYYCPNMTKAPKIPETVVDITGAFHESFNLSGRIEIPDSVRYMDRAFFMTGSIEVPEIPYGVESLDHTFADSGLINAPIIPDTVTDMSSTFYGCIAMQETPVIPEGVTSLAHTFEGSGIINPPIIPNTVTDLYSTFSGCTSLIKMPVIPDGVINMEQAFWDCVSLKTATTIPSSVKNIYYAFYNCRELTGTIEINANPEQYYGAFEATVKPIILTGSSTMLNAIATEAYYLNGNVTVGQ